jgi:predicted CopG family antitoxin
LVIAIRTLTDNAVTQNQFYSELKDLMHGQQTVSEQITQLISRNNKKEVVIICLAFAIGMLSGQLDWLTLLA